MKYQELIILLPCHSLEDFPTYHEGEDADSLLASWTALWHPALLAAAGVKPTWARVDSPPSVIVDRLLVVPTLAASQLPTGFAQRAKEEGATLVRKLLTVPDIVAAALAPLDGGDGGVDPELAADFHALGYCYLQVQLLTRQMRYSSNLDEVHFQNQVIAGARAALASDNSTAREKLTACFDMLAEERNHYYPVETYVLDLTLVADTTIGPSLRTELARDGVANLLVSGATLQRMQSQEPDSLAAVRAAVEANRAALIGGEVVERRWPLLGLESLTAELQRGAAVYETLVGRRPTVFGRRRFGLTPAFPLVLRQNGYQGVLHATLDDGRFPQGSQLKVRWEGIGDASLDAIARVPLDAAKSQTFLSYAMKMGESMDADHVATLLLAHWPGQASAWREVLRRVAKYTGALGKFVTIDQYFRETDAPSQTDRFDAGQYRSPYLKQAIIRKQLDPLSTVMRYWQRRSRFEAAESLRLLAELAGGSKGAAADDADAAFLQEAALAIDLHAEDPETDVAQLERLDRQLDDVVHRSAERLANVLPRAGSKPTPGLLLINPCTFTRRVTAEAPHLPSLPAVEKPVHAVDEAQGKRHLVADVPPLGYTWVSASGASPAKPRRPLPPLAEDTILRNEYFEALLNPTTGSLQAIHEYQARGNRMSQQLALRVPGASQQKAGDVYRDPDETAVYSVMGVDKIEVTAASTVLGEITTRGRLMDRQGKTQANYTQIFRVRRGSRVLVIDIELEPVVEPLADPWNSYYCCRFAWNNESSDLFRTLHQQRQPVAGKQFEAPHYVELVAEPQRTTIFTGGLPFHRRVGMRMLDTLLVVRGERARRFRVGIGIDVTHPYQEAVSLHAPQLTLPETNSPPNPASSWLFHLDAKNVATTHWSPVREGGKLVGFRTRLLETMGRGGPVKLSACRTLTAASKLDLQGQPVETLPVENGQAVVQLTAHDWTTVEARWG